MVCAIISTFKDDWKELKQSLASVVAQSGQVIVSMVDSDPNVDLVQEQFKGVDTVVVDGWSHPGHSPQGSFIQINRALPYIDEAAKYVRWFSGDDYLHPNANQRQVEQLQKTGKKVCYGDYLRQLDGVEVRQSFYEYSREQHQITSFVNDVALWDVSLLKYCPFNWKDWGNYAFWDFWLRVYKVEGDVFTYLPEVIWTYRIRQKSTHQKRLNNKDAKAIYDKQRKEFLEYHAEK